MRIIFFEHISGHKVLSAKITLFMACNCLRLITGISFFAETTAVFKTAAVSYLCTPSELRQYHV
jgi:hypothetical protein